MNVLVERYQRRKYVNQENAPMLYYIRQKSGNVRVMDIDTIATAIESKSALTAGDVKHTIEAFVEQLRASLTQGDKVKIDGLGTFHITLTSDGTELMKECTVRSIRRVNVRFVADKALKLMLAKNHDYDEAWRSMRITSYTDLILMKIYRTKQIENNNGKTLVSEGVDANYMDMINYAVFGLIKLEFGE